MLSFTKFNPFLQYRFSGALVSDAFQDDDGEQGHGHGHGQGQGDRHSQLKSRRDALIVRVYEMKREIDKLQREMDQLDADY